MLFIIWTVYQISSFEFIRVEGGVMFMNLFKGGAFENLFSSAYLIL
jgi:hypothetical protein